MAYLYDLWVADSSKQKLYDVYNDALAADKTFDTDAGPTAVLVDINQIDVWVVFTKLGKVGQFRDGKFIKYIIVGSNPMGIAQAPNGAIYVTNYASGTISKIVDGKVTMTIYVGTGPRGVCCTPDGAVWVTNYLSNTVSKIVNDVNITPNGIPVGLNPYGIVGDKLNNAWVCGSSSNIVSKITGTTKMLDFNVGKLPYGITIDKAGTKFVTCYAGNVVVPISNDKVGEPISVGKNPFAIAPTKDGAVYCLNFQDGTASKIVANKVVATIQFGTGTNPHAFGDFTGYLSYYLFKETTGGGTTPVSNITFADLDPTLQQMINSISLPISDKYVNHDNPDYPTVDSALDYLLYKAPAVSAFTNNVNVVEMGSTVNAAILNWSFNKTMVSQIITDIGDIPVATTTKSLSGLNLTIDKTWTLTGTDEKGAVVSKTTSINFRNKRYWGVSANPSLVDADILALSGSEFATDYKASKTFDASGGKYIYFIVPSTFGLDNTHFKMGGLANSDWIKTTVQFKNASGYSTSYDIFRSTNIQSGAAILIDVA